MHAQTRGASVNVATLIPHMLETFIARDRGFTLPRSAALVLPQAAGTPAQTAMKKLVS